MESRTTSVVVVVLACMLMNCSKSADDYRLAGELALDKEDYQNAIKLLSQAISKEPKHAVALFTRARAQEGLGRIDDAIGDYTASLSINPTFVNAKFNRARLYVQKRRYREAIEDLTAALESDPGDDLASRYVISKFKNQSAYYLRGVAHELAGHVEDAIRDYTRALWAPGGGVDDARAALLRHGQRSLRELERVPQKSTGHFRARALIEEINRKPSTAE